jgi:uroporphyrinogen decarboxylase
MTPRERFITVLEGGQVSGRVPHFELVFFLTMEAFGRVHHSQRAYHQWDQMSETERALQRRDMADLYVTIARAYEHSAIFYQGFPQDWKGEKVDENLRLLDEIRNQSGDDYFLMMHGDATYGLPSGNKMMKFISEIADNPQRVKNRARRSVARALRTAETYRRHGVLDGYALCSDYCFNSGPFLSPAMFEEFVAPYLAELVAGYREMGFYTIKHTDGNIMPILDALVAARPHALHSLDPQGGVDIAKLKRTIGEQVCLIGNVNCGLLDTGTDEQCIESARYALRHGMPGGGYIFSTSNCVYTGMALRRYELILDVWRREGNYS